MYLLVLQALSSGLVLAWGHVGHLWDTPQGSMPWYLADDGSGIAWGLEEATVRFTVGPYASLVHWQFKARTPLTPSPPIAIMWAIRRGERI